MEMDERNERVAKRRYDREYATEWRKERDWLAEHNFLPTYVKRLPNGVERYKYKKTAALFEYLTLFYQLQEAESEWQRMERGIKDGDMIGSGKMSDWAKIAGDLHAAVQAANDEWEDDTI